MINVPTQALQPYKVSSNQLRRAFPDGQIPEELAEKGSAYLITDKPTMYPDFTDYVPPSPQPPTMTDVGGPVDHSPEENPNAALAQDMLNADKGDPLRGTRPLGFRRYGNRGV